MLGVVFAFDYPDGEGDLFAWARGLRAACAATACRCRGGFTGGAGPLDVVLVSSKGDRDPETNLRCCAPARYRTLPSIAHRLALLAAGEGAATSSLWAPRDWDYGGGHALLQRRGRRCWSTRTGARSPTPKTATAAAGTPSAARGRWRADRGPALGQRDAAGPGARSGPRTSRAGGPSRTPRCCAARRAACWARSRATAWAAWWSS